VYGPIFPPRASPRVAALLSVSPSPPRVASNTLDPRPIGCVYHRQSSADPLIQFIISRFRSHQHPIFTSSGGRFIQKRSNHELMNSVSCHVPPRRYRNHQVWQSKSKLVHLSASIRLYGTSRLVPYRQRQRVSVNRTTPRASKSPASQSFPPPGRFAPPPLNSDRRFARDRSIKSLACQLQHKSSFKKPIIRRTWIPPRSGLNANVVNPPAPVESSASPPSPTSTSWHFSSSRAPEIFCSFSSALLSLPLAPRAAN